MLEILRTRVAVERLGLQEEPYIDITSIPGLLVIRRPLYSDERGSFQEIFRRSDVEAVIGREVVIAQPSRSRTRPGVLRGIHAENQDKIVTPQSGKILVVIVDLRPDSPTFREWSMFDFDNTNPNTPLTTLFVANGLGNSFFVIEADSDGETAEYGYCVSENYDPETAEMGVMWNDPELNIPWPHEQPALSNRDQNLLSLEKFVERYR